MCNLKSWRKTNVTKDTGIEFHMAGYEIKNAIIDLRDCFRTVSFFYET